MSSDPHLSHSLETTDGALHIEQTQPVGGLLSGVTGVEEEEFWRMERYAYRWPPPWLSKMQNETNPVVFLDIAIRSLDRC